MLEFKPMCFVSEAELKALTEGDFVYFIHELIDEIRNAVSYWGVYKLFTEAAAIYPKDGAFIHAWKCDCIAMVNNRIAMSAKRNGFYNARIIEALCGARAPINGVDTAECCYRGSLVLEWLTSSEAPLERFLQLESQEDHGMIDLGERVTY